MHVRLDVPEEGRLCRPRSRWPPTVSRPKSTNVVRHSQATGAMVRLRCNERLELSITDDGPPNGAWAPGVGLDAMRERAAELGGSFQAGPTPTGGQVVASFPLP